MLDRVVMREPHPEVHPPRAELLVFLRNLYVQQRALLPANPYLQEHSTLDWTAHQVATFRWYAQYLPEHGRILDWGCYHAPDSSLLAAAFPGRFLLEACDVGSRDRYEVFHNQSGVRYAELTHPWQLPYEDGTFDVVISSGALEHVPSDYLSLGEVYRVLKERGRLIITSLPNRESRDERRLRRQGLGHRRLYDRGEVARMLPHFGFAPVTPVLYQTTLFWETKLIWLGAMPKSNTRIERRFIQLIEGLHRLYPIHRKMAPTFCCIVEKVAAL